MRKIDEDKWAEAERLAKKLKRYNTWIPIVTVFAITFNAAALGFVLWNGGPAYIAAIHAALLTAILMYKKTIKLARALGEEYLAAHQLVLDCEKTLIAVKEASRVLSN